MGPPKTSKPHGHSKSFSKHNYAPEARDDVPVLPISPGFTKRSAHKGGHQRSYSMLAEPFSRGYCGIGSEKSYSFPKKDPNSLYGYPLANSPPAFTNQHHRFPSTQISSHCLGAYDNSTDHANPLSHSFSSRSESGKEVFYFAMPTTPLKTAPDGTYQTSSKTGADSTRLNSSSRETLGSLDKLDASSSGVSSTKNTNGNKAPEVLASKIDTFAAENSQKRSLSDGIVPCSKKADPPLQCLLPKRKISHKKHKTLGGTFDLRLLEEPASAGVSRLPSELLNLGDETIVELFDLLVNYQNPWGTRSVDEGQISKEIQDESQVPSCDGDKSDTDDSKSSANY